MRSAGRTHSFDRCRGWVGRGRRAHRPAPSLRQPCGFGCLGSVASMTAWTHAACSRCRDHTRSLSGVCWCAASRAAPPAHTAPRAPRSPHHMRCPRRRWSQFHPGREGTPRYASPKWVDHMLAARRSSPSGAAMRLAAHLCGPAINQVLRGDVSFVKELAAKGFGRVQLNATAVRQHRLQELPCRDWRPRPHPSGLTSLCCRGVAV